MRNIFRCLIFLFLMITMTSLIFADTVYYVDATNGDDSNNGLSDTNAWKTISKVNSSSFSPGDTIKFKKGETWRDQLKPPSSGSAGNPITFTNYGTGNNPLILGSIDYDDASKWTNIGGNQWATAVDSFTDTRNALFYDTNSTPQIGVGADISDPSSNWEWMYDSVNDRVIVYYDSGNPANQTNGWEIADNTKDNSININRDYITIDGIDMKFTRYAGLKDYGNSTDLKIKNCTISYTGQNGITCNGSTGNLLVDNNTISYTRNAGIHAKDLTSGTISNNTISYVCRIGLEKNGGWGMGIDISEGNGVTVDGNTIDTQTLGFPSRTSVAGIGGDNNNSCIIQNNVCSTGLFGGIDMSAGTGGNKTCNNNIIRYNKCYNNTSGGIVLQGSASQNSKAENNKVYYNICYGNKYGIKIVDDANSNEVYNNILYENDDNFYIYTPNEGVAEPENNVIKNNISYKTSAGQHIHVYNCTSTNNTFDYNCYYNDHPVCFKWNGSDYNTFSAYQSASGEDSNSLGRICPPFFLPLLLLI